MSSLSGMAKLRAALWQMEKDAGLADLSRNERDLLYAFHSVAAVTGGGEVSSEQVRTDGVVCDMKHATFHRSLKRLLELGYIEVAPERKTKVYILTGRPMGV
ncbi:hypothetical protein [Sagittula stellata]|uniref:MarR family transcriptional regulator n=1 Tax=Sagittula stellata (strain ATCC 700073 / DSM 11524 / E-37) TaxID=388399 RepID=A3K8Q6_SAGS3|nr:hypothetical protein [Sagittula stellata]EBA06494.1 hypothetical protein SSE37_14864 [Sagittula stellata E-37]